MRARERYTRHSSWRTSLYSPSYPARNGFNLGTGSSAPVSSGSTRRLRRDTRAESLSDSGSVEVVVTSPMRRPRRHAQQAASNNDTPVTPRVSPRRKGKRRNIYTPTTSPRKQRRFVAPPRDPAEADDLDDEVEIIVDMLQRAPKAKPQPTSKYRRASQQQPASTPLPVVSASISIHTSSPASSPPPPSPDVNSLDGLPLTILPAPARAGIVVPPRALSHLQTSSSPPSDDSRTQQMQRQAIWQGFCYEEPATGAHSLLANPLPLLNPPPSWTAALAPPHPIILVPVPVVSSARTWISTSTSLWATRTQMWMRRV